MPTCGLVDLHLHLETVSRIMVILRPTVLRWWLRRTTEQRWLDPPSLPLRLLPFAELGVEVPDDGRDDPARAVVASDGHGLAERSGHDAHLVAGEGVERNAGRVFGVHPRSEEHTSELQSRFDLVCRLLLEKKKQK